jgi:hypothetical protein
MNSGGVIYSDASTTYFYLCTFSTISSISNGGIAYLTAVSTATFDTITVDDV